MRETTQSRVERIALNAIEGDAVRVVKSKETDSLASEAGLYSLVSKGWREGGCLQRSRNMACGIAF